MTRERVALAGDGVLLTAALFGAITGATALLLLPDGQTSTGAEWLAGLSAVLSLGVAIAGPALVWLMYGRRITWVAVLGALLGGFAAGGLFMAFTLVAGALGWLVSSVVDNELAGLIALVVIIGVAFVAVVVWLGVDAVRDLAPARREHLRIDVVRIVSAVALGVFAVGLAIWLAGHPQDEGGEAMIFAIAMGFGAACALLGAEVATQ
ncbi:MAG TPA: hypothetical protein VN257_02370, partial [Actinotalea sp.]|nr:hypothetical protein [Actinotalea sp.]